MKGPKLLIWGLGAMVLLAVAIAATRPAAAIRKDIDNAELRSLEAQGARLVDVRSPGEFGLGHIQGAENVPVEQITQVAGSWDHEKAIVVYCATGARSFNAAQWLAANGFTKVYNLKNGIASWDGPVTKDASASSATVKTNGKPVFIDFYSDTWPVCIKMKPVVDRLKQQYAGKIEFRRLDANSNDPEVQRLANAFGVQYVPTFEFIDKDGRQVDQVVGEISEPALAKKLDALK